jgi:spore germination protein GerM
MNNGEKPKTLKHFVTAVFFILLFVAGIVAGYFFFTKNFSPSRTESTKTVNREKGDFTFIRLYYPTDGRLQLYESRVPRKDSNLSIAEATVQEYLKGPSGDVSSYVPSDTRLLGIYLGSDGILYIDLSDEFRGNFQGDALAEFLLLRGLYESLLSNVYGIEGVKILIEGKEVESIGGHISLLSPLGEVVSQTMEENAEQ